MSSFCGGKSLRDQAAATRYNAQSYLIQEELLTKTHANDQAQLLHIRLLAVYQVDQWVSFRAITIPIVSRRRWTRYLTGSMVAMPTTVRPGPHIVLEIVK